MCLGIPVKILQIEGMNAEVDIGGVQRRARLDVVDRQPEVGDYVIVHAGYAIQVIDEEEAKITLDYLKEFFSSEYEASQ